LFAALAVSKFCTNSPIGGHFQHFLPETARPYCTFVFWPNNHVAADCIGNRFFAMFRHAGDHHQKTKGCDKF